MKKWEHKILLISISEGIDDIEKNLNTLGKYGWELIAQEFLAPTQSIKNSFGRFLFVFRRELVEEEKEQEKEI